MKVLNSWVMLVGCVLVGIACHARSISIDLEEDYTILNQFFKMTCLSEEYGYVLEGSKPISIRNFLSLDSFPISKDVKREEAEFKKSILVHQAIPLWNKYCSQQKDFVLKVVALDNQKPYFLSSLEVAFINTAKLQHVIEKNIDLFQYILGSTNTVQDIMSAITTNNLPLLNILNNDLTLVGIVLGFGSHNSIVGGRHESICNLSISKDHPPFMPQSYLMQCQEEHSLDFLSPARYGGYYLELAGGNDANFRIESPRLKPQPKFNSLVDEIRSIDQLEDKIPDFLWNEPKFVFGAFKGGPSNQPLFDHLQNTQKKIRSLVDDPQFLKKVLGKINRTPCLIKIKKPVPTKTDCTLSQETCLEILHAVVNRFDDKEMKIAFVQALQTDQDFDPPIRMGASTTALEGLKKARVNLKKSDLLFDELIKDKSLTQIKNNLIYKIILPGDGNQLVKENRVRIRYVIEDIDGNILSAHHDCWVNRTELMLGFAHGMQGMHIHEERLLYIHPMLGYGALTTLPPCTALKVGVQLLDIDIQTQSTMLPLTPFDLSWVQDTSYYDALEKSLIQQPYFYGTFYRKILDKKSIEAFIEAFEVP